MERVVEEARLDSRSGKLADLYRRHSGEAMRLAYLLTGDEATAEDLFHDAFLRLAARWMTLRDPNAFAAYLKRTMVNLSVSRRRRSRIEQAYLERESRRPPVQTESVAIDEADEALWQAVQSLPRNQRAAIVLRFCDDLTDDEIAELLGCRTVTVRSHVSRGLATLRNICGGELDGN